YLQHRRQIGHPLSLRTTSRVPPDTRQRLPSNDQEAQEQSESHKPVFPEHLEKDTMDSPRLGTLRPIFSPCRTARPNLKTPSSQWLRQCNVGRELPRLYPRIQ